MLRRDFAQILAGRRDIYVGDALNLVMIDFRGRLHEIDAGHVAERRGRPFVASHES